MRPDVRRDPDALDDAATRLRGLAADLREVPATVAGEHGASARRIADELDSLAESALRAAGAVRATDEISARTFTAAAAGLSGPNGAPVAERSAPRPVFPVEPHLPAPPGAGS